MSGITTAAALAIGLGAAGTVAGAGASLYGASQQAGAAQSALGLQQQGLNFQEQQWQQQQQNEAPWLNAGKTALGELMNLPNFQAPTAAQAEATPGYQFQLQQGQQALEHSAAARGGLLSGGTLKGLDQYSQGLASSNYQQTYNNALQNWLTQYNKLAGISGTGQQTANALGQQGQQAANNISNIYGNQGNLLQNAAYQTASGYNAAAGQLGNLGQLAYLKNLMGGGQPPGYGSPFNGYNDAQIPGTVG